MSDYHHGVRVTEVNEGTRPIRTISTAILGFVATADDADADAFPLNKATLITNVEDAIGKAGKNGTLGSVLKAIDKQCQPLCVVVRIEEGNDEAATTANAVGGITDGTYTGLQALLTAKTSLNVTPRIIGAPFLDNLTVATELASLAQKLNAFTFVMAHGATTKEQAATYREQFAQREVMVIWPAATDAAGDELPTIAIAMGLRAKIDQETGWHKNISNVAFNGAAGLTKDVYFDLQNPASDAGYLNANEVTTIINTNGFRFWGGRTCSDDPLFAFEPVTRTAQVLRETIADSLLWAVDKPLTPGLVKSILGSINAKFRQMKTAELIVDATAWLDEKSNTSDTLKTGKLIIDYDYTAVPPLEDLGLNQRITDRYLADFAAQVQA